MAWDISSGSVGWGSGDGALGTWGFEEKAPVEFRSDFSRLEGLEEVGLRFVVRCFAIVGYGGRWGFVWWGMVLKIDLFFLSRPLQYFPSVSSQIQ